MLETRKLTLVIDRCGHQRNIRTLFEIGNWFLVCPEINCFPDEQGVLGDKFVAEALKVPNQNVVVSTWSEPAILRVRRLVAQGKIKSADVIIHYIDYLDNVTSITVDDDGEVSTWPLHLFGAAYDEVMALRREQRQRIRDELAKTWTWKHDRTGNINRVRVLDPKIISYRIRRDGEHWQTWSGPASGKAFGWEETLKKAKKHVEDEEVREAISKRDRK